jgi:hypothetical protein
MVSFLPIQSNDYIETTPARTGGSRDEGYGDVFFAMLGLLRLIDSSPTNRLKRSRITDLSAHPALFVCPQLPADLRQVWLFGQTQGFLLGSGSKKSYLQGFVSLTA